MLELARLEAGDRVLEVGVGKGDRIPATVGAISRHSILGYRFIVGNAPPLPIRVEEIGGESGCARSLPSRRFKLAVPRCGLRWCLELLSSGPVGGGRHRQGLGRVRSRTAPRRQADYSIDGGAGRGVAGALELGLPLVPSPGGWLPTWFGCTVFFVDPLAHGAPGDALSDGVSF